MMVRKLGLGALFAAAMFFAALGTAAAQNKCAGTKIKSTGKKAACLLGVRSKEASKGTTGDTSKCVAKFEKGFTKAETKGGCNTTGDMADIEAKVDAFVADTNSELAVAPLPNKCAGSKLKSAGKKASCLLGLESKQASKGGPLGDTAQCIAKFNKGFGKAETKGGCNTTGDQADIEAKVDAFVADAAAELDGSPSGAFLN